MIYNWNHVKPEDLLFVPVNAADLTKHGVQPPAAGETKYFSVDVPGTILLDDKKRYVHPTKEDVFIQGEKAFGLDAIVAARKSGRDWQFSFILHEMKKEVFAAPKSFQRSRP